MALKNPVHSWAEKWQTKLEIIRSKPTLLFVAKIFALLLGSMLVFVLSDRFLPVISDWTHSYRPAALALLEGRSPYEIESFISPPWILLPLMPLAIFSGRVSQIINFLMTIFVISFISRKQKASLLELSALLVSFPSIYGLIYGQVEWIVLLGLISPPWLALILFLTKPQAGIGIAIFLIIREWKSRSQLEFIKFCAPLGFFMLASYLLFGQQFFSAPITALPMANNVSLWPTSIPIGLLILINSYQKQDELFSLTAGPLLSPYLSAHTWFMSIFALIGRPTYLVIVSISTWIIWLLGGGPAAG